MIDPDHTGFGANTWGHREGDGLSVPGDAAPDRVGIWIDIVDAQDGAVGTAGVILFRHHERLGQSRGPVYQPDLGEDTATAAARKSRPTSRMPARGRWLILRRLTEIIQIRPSVRAGHRMPSRLSCWVSTSIWMSRSSRSLSSNLCCCARKTSSTVISARRKRSFSSGAVIRWWVFA